MERTGWKERNKTYWNEMREQRMEEAMASRDSKDERVGERGIERTRTGDEIREGSMEMTMVAEKS